MSIKKGDLITLKHFLLTEDLQTIETNSVGLVVNVHGSMASVVSLTDGKLSVEPIEDRVAISGNADFALNLITNHFKK